MTASPRLTREQVAAFLAEHHGAAITELTPLGGGLWSSAYGYEVDGQELVARFGAMREGYEMDREATVYSSADLPVPEVLHVGEGFDAFCAISVRHHGRFLEDLTVDEAAVGGATLTR